MVGALQDAYEWNAMAYYDFFPDISSLMHFLRISLFSPLNCSKGTLNHTTIFGMAEILAFYYERP